MMITVDANWLLSRLDAPTVVVIDGRGMMPYRFGHIKNSTPLNVEQVVSIDGNGSNLVISSQTAEKVFSHLGIDDSKTVVVYGEYPDPSAARIVWTLIYYGHKDAKLLDIGYNQWQKAGLPITTDATTYNSKTKDLSIDMDTKFVAKINHATRANDQTIKEKQNDPNVVIVDARTPQEHFQARIPGSILLNWEEGLGDYGQMLKDKDALLKGFEEKGITADKEVICYCHAGMRASHKYLQLKQAGFDNVRVYDGSIIDWAQRRNPLR
ncbi:MAG TPA: rhodanese-like domain-containing protein [Phototrophicaceae bacterium]|nr:rhodanese-like domain-containing protein [Phototrophicaceae bacterium]